MGWTTVNIYGGTRHKRNPHTFATDLIIKNCGQSRKPEKAPKGGDKNLNLHEKMKKRRNKKEF